MAKTYKRIEDIIIKRDGCTREEAREIVNEAVELIEEAHWDINAVEEIMNYELGLEMDYAVYLM